MEGPLWRLCCLRPNRDEVLPHHIFPLMFICSSAASAAFYVQTPLGNSQCSSAPGARAAGSAPSAAPAALCREAAPALPAGGSPGKPQPGRSPFWGFDPFPGTALQSFQIGLPRVGGRLSSPTAQARAAWGFLCLCRVRAGASRQKILRPPRSGALRRALPTAPCDVLLSFCNPASFFFSFNLRGSPSTSVLCYFGCGWVFSFCFFAALKSGKGVSPSPLLSRPCRAGGERGWSKEENTPAADSSAQGRE